MNNGQSLKTSTDGDVNVIHLAEMVNERELVIEFTEQLVRFVDDFQPSKLQLNFVNVRFFSTEAINAVLRANRRVKALGGRMVLCGMSKDLRHVFKLLGLDGTVLEIHDSCEDATAAMSKVEY